MKKFDIGTDFEAYGEDLKKITLITLGRVSRIAANAKDSADSAVSSAKNTVRGFGSGALESSKRVTEKGISMFGLTLAVVAELAERFTPASSEPHLGENPKLDSDSNHEDLL